MTPPATVVELPSPKSTVTLVIVLPVVGVALTANVYNRGVVPDTVPVIVTVGSGRGVTVMPSVALDESPNASKPTMPTAA